MNLKSLHIPMGLILTMLVSVTLAETVVDKGDFRLVLDDQGRGNLFYRGKAVFDRFEPGPYMRNANYSLGGIPEESQVVEREDKDGTTTIRIRGGNPVYLTCDVHIVLSKAGVTIQRTYTSVGDIRQVGVGRRYYIGREWFYNQEVENTGPDGKTATMVLGENRPHWLIYGVGELRARELTFRLGDGNYWYLQNLQSPYRVKEPYYLLFFELPDWKPGQKRTWTESLTISPTVDKPSTYEHSATYQFPDYIKGWEDKKYDLYFGKRPAIYLNKTWKLIKLSGTEKNPADDYGTRKGFFTPDYDASGWKDVFVPWNWNDGDKFAGVGWYRKTFSVPPEYRGRRLILKFSEVLSDATVYVNGQRVGSHAAYWTGFRSEYGAFEFDITKYIRWGSENLLAVRVYHSAGDFGGIWQPVQIDVVPEVYLEKALVNSHVDKNQVEVRCLFNNATGKDRTINLTARLGPWTSFRYQPPDVIAEQPFALGQMTLPPGMTEKTFTLSINQPKAWTYERPNLYHLKFLVGEEVLGRTRFGFREITIRGTHFYLNGKKMWVPGDQHEGLVKRWPFLSFNQDVDKNEGGWDNPKTSYDARACNFAEWLDRYKKLNLILIRSHSETWSEPMFDRADEVGMLVYPEFSHPECTQIPQRLGRISLFEAYAKDRHLPEGFKTQARERIYAHWNHPSIWAYSLGNELYGSKFSPYLCEFFDYLKKDVKIPFPLTQSGRYYAQKSRDIFTPKPDFYDDHFYWTWDNLWVNNESTCSELKTYIDGRLDRPWFNGECFGCFQAEHYNMLFFEDLKKGLPEIPRDQFVSLCLRTEKDFGQYRREMWPWAKRYVLLYGIRELLLETERGDPGRGEFYKRKIETHRRWNDYVTGFATHRIMPPRQDKMNVFGEIMTRVNSPLYVCADIYFKRHFFAGEKFSTTLFTFNDSLEDVSDISIAIRITGEDGKTVHTETLNYPFIPQGEKKVQPFSWAIPKDLPTGHYRLLLTLNQKGKKVLENDYGTYILGPDRRRKEIKPIHSKVALYCKSGDPLFKGTRYDTGYTRHLLDGLRVPYQSIADFESLESYPVLILGMNSFDAKLKSASPRIRKWVEGGGKLLCFEQTDFLGPVPFAREMQVGETQPSKADLIVPRHPAFAGLTNPDWDPWDGEKGIINYKYLQPLSPCVLAVSGVFGNFGMTAAEVRVGKGILFFSQAEATLRYGKDSVATRYLENLLHYTLETPWDGKGIEKYDIPAISGKPIEGYEIAPLSAKDTVYIDLTGISNRGFIDQQGHDGKGGWFDEGDTEVMKHFPVGLHTLEGIPFSIIDPDKNHGKSCIVLHTKGNGRFPQGDRPESVEIPVRHNVRRLVFLVASAWTEEGQNPAATLVLHFSGGKCLYETEEISLKSNVNLGNWWLSQGTGILPGAKVAWTYRDAKMSSPVGVWMFEWKNRQPQAELRSIVFKTNHTQTIPALIAITGEKFTLEN